MPIVNSKMPWAMAHGATLTAILKDFGFKTYGLKKKDMEDILVQIEKSGLDSVIERQTHRAPEIVLDNDDNDQDFIPENTTGTSYSTNVDDHEMSKEDVLQEDEHTPRRSTRSKRKRDEADDQDSNEDIRPLTSSPTTRLSTRNTRNKRRAPTPPIRGIQSRSISPEIPMVPISPSPSPSRSSSPSPGPASRTRHKTGPIPQSPPRKKNLTNGHSRKPRAREIMDYVLVPQPTISFPVTVSAAKRTQSKETVERNSNLIADMFAGVFLPLSPVQGRKAKGRPNKGKGVAKLGMEDVIPARGKGKGKAIAVAEEEEEEHLPMPTKSRTNLRLFEEEEEDEEDGNISRRSARHLNAAASGSRNQERHLNGSKKARHSLG